MTRNPLIDEPSDIEPSGDLASLRRRVDSLERENAELRERLAASSSDGGEDPDAPRPPTAAARKMKRDLEAAARIQKSLLPTTLPEVPGVAFSWTFRPCDELAGDNLNVIRLDDEHVGLYVLDVSGHGVPASLLAVTLYRVLSTGGEHGSILRRPRRRGGGFELTCPTEVAAQLNREFSMHLEYRQYFTILYGILNTRTHDFRFVSGGHWGPIHVPAGEPPRLLHARGFPIGVFEDTEYDLHRVRLAPGDRVLLYSDGIPEARSADGDLFDYRRIEEALEACRDSDLAGCLASLLARVDEFAVVQDDDISMLAFEITGSRS